MIRPETAEILAFLDRAVITHNDVAKKIAGDFRARRVEKGFSRVEIARVSGVALSNVARFEQKGLISLQNLIKLAQALGYEAELKNIFAGQKYSTLDELALIRKNAGKTKAYPTTRKDEKN